MQLTEALNYMKTIIDNGKQRKNRPISVKEGLIVYLRALVTEGSVSTKDLAVLKGVVKQTDAIMDSRMTVDEAFVRSLCSADNNEYTSLKSEVGQVIKPEEQRLKPKKANGNKTVKRKEYTFSGIKKEDEGLKKILEEASSTPSTQSNETETWEPFVYKPTGSCGRIEEGLREAARQEWWERNHPSHDEVWSKCRH